MSEFTDVKSTDRNHRRVLLISQAALLAALSYIGFQFFRIDIPVGIEKTAFHFGNVFLILAALLIGGFWGGMAGAVGMGIADLTSGYASSAPATFILKLLFGLVVGLVAEKILHLREEQDRSKQLLACILSSAAGVFFNVFADPLVRFLIKKYIIGLPADLAAALAKLNAVTTLVNGVVAVIAVSLIYMAIRPALEKSNLLL